MCQPHSVGGKTKRETGAWSCSQGAYQREKLSRQVKWSQRVSGTENDRRWEIGQGVLPELNLKGGKELVLVRAGEEQARLVEGQRRPVWLELSREEKRDRVPFSVKVMTFEPCLFCIPVGHGACLLSGDLELRNACVAGVVAPTARIGPAVQEELNECWWARHGLLLRSWPQRGAGKQASQQAVATYCFPKRKTVFKKTPGKCTPMKTAHSSATLLLESCEVRREGLASSIQSRLQRCHRTHSSDAGSLG